MGSRASPRWLGLAALALLPRTVAALVHRPWHDEYFTAWAAALPLDRLLAALRLDSGPPLPYVLARFGAGLLPGPLAAARAVSVLAGTAAVLVAAHATTKSMGRAAGRFAGILLATHPLAVAWSSEARAYPLLLLAGALVWDGLAGLHAEGRGAYRLGLGVALGCWSHGLGLILAATAAATGLALPAPARRRALVAAAAGLASFAPWLPVMAQQPPAAVAWMVASWQAMPGWGRAVAAIRLLPPAAEFGSFTDLPAAPSALALAAALVAVALLASARREPLAWLTLALPTIGLTALATAGLPVFYPGRGEALYLVPACALLASGAASSRWRLAGAGALALAGAVTTAVALRAWAAQPPRPEAALAGAVRTALPEGGVVVTSGYWWLDLSFQLGPDAASYELVEVPAGAERHPGWYADGEDRLAPGELDRLAARLAAAPRRAAIVVTPGLVTEPGLRRLASRAGLAPRAAVPGAVLFLPSLAAGR